MTLLLDWLPWLLGTLLLELAVVLVLAPPAARRRTLLVCAAANLCTHPLAFLLQRLGWYDLLSLELLVAVAEGLIYLRLVPLAPGRATAVTALANLASGAAALVVWAIMTG